MKTELKPSLPYNPTIILLLIISVLSAALTCVVGDILMPVLVSVLASVYLFDKSSKRIYSLIATLIICVINIVVYVLGVSISFFGVCAAILAAVLVYAFVRGDSKADSTLLMTVIYMVFIVCSLAIFVMIDSGEFSLNAVKDYYFELNDSLRTVYIEAISEVYVVSGFELSEEVVAGLVDTLLRLVIFYLFVMAFAVVGLSAKLFSLIVYRISNDNSHIAKWRFAPTNLFAYFYVILMLATMFSQSADSVFGVSVMNLYSIFLVIFAYVGFNSAIALLTRRIKPVLAFLVLCGAILLFSSFALQMLAVMGVLFTIRNNRMITNDKAI